MERRERIGGARKCMVKICDDDGHLRLGSFYT